MQRSKGQAFKKPVFFLMPARAPLVFLHIPKTAGIAVSSALLTAERPSRVFFGFDRAFFGGFSDFASVPAENRAYIHLTPESIPRNETFVRAHMALSTLRAAYPGGRFMVVLREPVCRVLSHFVFWRGFTAEQDQGWGGWAARSGLARGSLEAFLEAPDVACQIDNVATRLLLWPHTAIPENGMIDPAVDAELIAAAEARLDFVDFVDFVENTGIYANLAAWLGADIGAPARLNESGCMPDGLRVCLDGQLTARACVSLAARSRLDLALWEAVVRRRGCEVGWARGAALAKGVARVARLLEGVHA
jgi:hypothetical protein